jgi:hemin uptake protein HemP
LEPKNTAELRDAFEAKRLNTETLFGGQNEIFIVHHDVEYRLRITRNDKLILTK